MMVGLCLIVKGARLSWYEQEFHIHAEGCTQVYLKAGKNRGDITAAELFAGMAGWSNPMEQAGLKVSVFVDSHQITAMCLAKKLQVPCISAEEYVQRCLQGELLSQVVLCDDVNTDMVWVALGLANVGLIAGSPPCQPWSGATEGRGLACEGGQAFLRMLEGAVEVGIPLVMAENVPGFFRHDDYQELLARAVNKGMKLAISGIFESKYVLPISRKRWLGTFVHTEVQLDSAKVQQANGISFSNHVFHSIARSPSIDVRDVLHIHMSTEERRELVVTQDAIDLMSKSEYAPQWLLEAISGRGPREVFEGRVIKLDQQFRGFMSKYGSQHLLSDDLLRSRGLQTSILVDDDGARYISPWEMIAAMGYGSDVVLAADIHTAWQMAGNGITCAHVWLALYKTHVVLGDLSPFGPFNDVCRQAEIMLGKAAHLSEFTAIREGEFWMLQPHVDDSEHEHKKRKCEATIPDTVPFEVDELMQTKQFQVVPEFFQLSDPRCVAAGLVDRAGILIVMQHSEKHWMMIVNAAAGETISEVVRKGLPHATNVHFQSITLQNQVVGWDHLLNVGGVLKLVFTPTFREVLLHETKMQETIRLCIDTTWTVKTAIAYTAGKLLCNPESLALQKRDYVLQESEFLMNYETTEFKLTFKACMPAYVSWDKATHSKDDVGLRPADGTCERIVARHPMKKVIRTCVITRDVTVNQAVHLLFPDLHAGVAWTVYQAGMAIPNNALVWNWNEFEIQWNGFRPIPVTRVYKPRFATPMDSPTHQVNWAGKGAKRFVRTPFKVKPQEMWGPKDATMAEITASFFQQSQANVSLLVESNGRVMDPNMNMEETNPEDVISFRVCPLLGGGKHDAIKAKVKSLLIAKGVPEDAVTERVQQLFTKVPPDHVFKYKDDDDSAFWSKLKDDASDAKFRLITPKELKAFQVAQRQNKSDSVEHKSRKVSKTKAFTPDAAQIKVDVSHVKVGDESVQLLEACRFGPDQSGLCIVTCKEANQCIAAAAKSCDPLALLIIGEGAHHFGQTFMLPAHLANNEPVVVPAVLKQFGDTPIEFTLKLPTTVVATMASTVIEFSICREYVGTWDDTALPMNYLGIHIPALRGSNLLAQWSVKSWSKNKPVPHGQADRWHGFIRIADSLLSQVLQRSGVSGVFLNPKAENKRHDPRYIALPVPSKVLSEVIAKAEGHAESLGIVRMGQGFGIRCKREESTQLRAKLSPESAFVEQAAPAADDIMFVLRNVPQISRDDLTNALTRMGWEARALRAQGVSRWLVASKVEPQSLHMVVNNSIVVIERLHKRQGAQVHVIASELKVNTVVDSQQQLVSTTTTSRISEMRAQVEEQISQAVEQKLAGANAKIAELSNQIQVVQQQAQAAQQSMATDLNNMKEEQGFTRQKLVEVENSVAASAQTVVQQMQQMFAQMESKMQTLVQTEYDPEKRARVGDLAKSDPFSTKA
eukprot:Skav216516  [mRNA]  locus=scaffold4485:34675:39015:+ [translate_table: standard]